MRGAKFFPDDATIARDVDIFLFENGNFQSTAVFSRESLVIANEGIQRERYFSKTNRRTNETRLTRSLHQAKLMKGIVVSSDHLG